MSGSPDRSTSPAELALFPTAGYWVDADSIRVTIAGIARRRYAPTISKRLLIKMLGSIMRADDHAMASPMFSERVLPFVSDGSPREPIVCEFAGKQFALKRTTKRNGFFGQAFQFALPAAIRESAQAANGTWKLPVRIIRPQLDSEYQGFVYVYRPQGWSVVSDIDDTIKESEINDRQSMLVNTFLREFRAVEQMSQTYTQWAQQGVDFHYVSSSPWQLLGPLYQLLSEGQFPDGSLHLRPFRLRNHMLQRMVRIRRTQKARVIRTLIRTMPARRFVMIGDSGEKDLQIYGKLAKKYPEQVKAVLIRDLPHHPTDHELLKKVQRRCPRIVCQSFQAVDQLLELAQSLFPKPSGQT